MSSNDHSKITGNSEPHNTGNKGSMSAVRAGSRSLPLYLLIVCLGLLNTILMLTAIVIGVHCVKVSEVSAPDLTAETLLIEFKELQVMKTEVIQAQEEAKKAVKEELRKHQKFKPELEQNQTLCDHLQTQIETHQVEKATLQSKMFDLQSSCGRCLPGWQLINSSCYFHSILETNSYKTWPDSRADCISRGANLAVIDSLEEHKSNDLLRIEQMAVSCMLMEKDAQDSSMELNLWEFLPKKDPSVHLHTVKGTWIGLMYVWTERRWVWSNNVTFQGPGYWNQAEPNDQATPGGACVSILQAEDAMRTWSDSDCLLGKEWLCEMEPN